MGAVVMLAPRGRVPAHAGALALRMYPAGDYAHGPDRRVWLYAIGFSDGRVKLGIAQRPRERLRSYFTSSGGAIDWVHLFERLPGTARHGSKHPVERDALARAGRVAHRAGHTEYFTGLTKAEAIRCVREAIGAAREAA